MRTRAAVVRGPGQRWELTELELDEPKDHEVLVRVMACGLCHSDEHVREGGPYRYPMIGGHEGAGVVEKVGPSVSRVREGDHICTSWIPVCGHCRYCSTGHQNMCDAGLNAATGMFPDGTFRFHENGEDLGGMCVLGTFSQWIVIPENSCVPIDDEFDQARMGWRPADRPSRLRLLADAYGLDADGGGALIGALEDAMDRIEVAVRRAVEAREPNAVALWERTGGAERYARRRRWWAGHHDAFAAALR